MRKFMFLFFVAVMSLTVKLKAQTSFIPVDSANKMIESYLASISSGSYNLKSLVFEADSLRALLNNESQIKKVRIFFAHTLSYINGGGQNQSCGYQMGALTLVIAGYDENGNYRYYPSAEVMDTGMPCPTSCPTVGEAASDLLSN